MNNGFKFNIYSRRWGHNDHHSLQLTDNGWIFSSVFSSGECDKQGSPFLFKTLDHETINYPKDLGEYLEYLWDQVKEQELNNKEIQEALDMISNWINICEKNSPAGLWQGFK